jgi:hypothetical protein
MPSACLKEAGSRPRLKPLAPICPGALRGGTPAQVESVESPGGFTGDSRMRRSSRIREPSPSAHVKQNGSRTSPAEKNSCLESPCVQPGIFPLLFFLVVCVDFDCERLARPWRDEDLRNQLQLQTLGQKTARERIVEWMFAKRFGTPITSADTDSLRTVAAESKEVSPTGPQT